MGTPRPGGLTRDHVVWAYRLLLDRDPESDDVIDSKLAGSANTAELRRHLITSAEFRQKNPDLAHNNDRTVVIKEIAEGVRLFIDLADHVIGLNILRGRYEEHAIALMRTLLHSGDTAVDAGAHIGVFAMQMAAIVGPGGRVYAFEPLDSNAELLERSIDENGFGDRIVFRRAAVGAAVGTATLTFAAETLNTGGAYLLPDGKDPLTGNQTVRIPVVALDDLPIRRPVRLIKMDVEGAEPQVLRGAARILRDDRPAVISELHPVQLNRASGASPDDFIAQVRALGYGTHTIDKAGIGPPLERAPSTVLASVILIPQA